jgi:protein-S-isoprenylcysteine O-methyltransferase Ste14
VGLKSASLAAVVVLVAAVVTLLLRHALFATGAIAIAVQVLAALLMIWARRTFGLRSFHAGANPTSGGIVTTGPYRYIRHPIYAAILYFVAAGVLSHASTTNVTLGVIAVAATAVRMVAEERLLVETYPEYAAYAARTKRILPAVL